MQFGKPWEQRRERYRAPQGDKWVRWFAWYPVGLDDGIGKTAWWETVEWRYWNGMTYNLPEYRAVTADDGHNPLSVLGFFRWIFSDANEHYRRQQEQDRQISKD